MLQPSLNLGLTVTTFQLIEVISLILFLLGAAAAGTAGLNLCVDRPTGVFKPIGSMDREDRILCRMFKIGVLMLVMSVALKVWLALAMM